jgi:hypothetical protein
MSLDTPGAVLLLEARVNARSRLNHPEAIEGRLSEVRLLLEASVGSAHWVPAGGPGVSGTLSVTDPNDALMVLHRLRTEIRADPEKPAIAIACGIGRGDEVEGAKLASQAFTSLGKKRDRLTCALTSDPDTNRILHALCRTLDSLHGGWTRAQWQAVQRRDSGETLQEIGRELGIAYQNVSKRLIAARYSLYCEVLEAANLLFARAPVPVA